MASCVRTVHEQRRAHTLLRALCCSERASTASVGRPVERRDGATADVLFTFAVQKSTPPLHHSTAQRRKRSPPQAHRDVPRPRHCRARARCAAPCTRAHACRARSTRTNHACAPRQPCTCSHVATHACTSKAWLPCSSHWPLADRRPARRWHIWLAHALQARSPSPLRAIPMHRRHAVHAIHLHRHAVHAIHRTAET